MYTTQQVLERKRAQISSRNDGDQRRHTWEKGEILDKNICHKSWVNFLTFVGKFKKKKQNKNTISSGIGLSGPGISGIRQRNAVIAF